MKINEENFISQLINKNESALDYVVDNYGWIIRTVVRKHLLNLEELQEECMNDVLLGIWNNIENYNPDKSEFKNWVAGISRFKAIDCRRKHMKNLVHESYEELEDVSSDIIQEQILKNHLEDEIAGLLACLKETDRELFTKLYVEELDMEEVSRSTGMKRDVIYNRLSRGKKKLRDMFKIIENRS